MVYRIEGKDRLLERKWEEDDANVDWWKDLKISADKGGGKKGLEVEENLRLMTNKKVSRQEKKSFLKCLISSKRC